MRFPEFSGEWEYKSLGEIGESLIGLTYSPSDVVKEGGTIVFRSSNIQDGVIDYGDLVRVSKKIKDSIITRDGDLLICARNGSTRLIGKNALLKKSDEGQTFGAFMMVFRSIDNRFVHQLLSTKAYSTQVSENLGARINQITTRNFAEYTFGMPQTSEEKEKIGTFLELINDRIETQSKIIEELKTLRGALNESLYCCCESYQELSFNDVGVSYSGLSGKSGNDFGSGYPFIPYTNIFTNNIIDEGQLDYVQVREDESQNSVCFGDLLMTLSSETPEEVGIGAVYLGHESPLYLNSFAFGIHITRTDLVYPPYLSWLVSTKSFRKFILPYAQGSTRYNLQKTDFMKAKYRFPTLGRQKAISVLLSGYSSKIENEERVLNKYTALKQGLIEQLFI